MSGHATHNPAVHRTLRDEAAQRPVTSTLEVFMFSRIKRWYDGEPKMQEFDNDPDDSIVILPYFYTEYHWSAKIAHAIVSFYLRHWQWIWSTIIAVLGLYVAVLSLK